LNGFRKNASQLEEKEQKEKELRAQIVAEAEEFKKAFYEKRIRNCADNMINNRESEKVCRACLSHWFICLHLLNAFAERCRFS
jgi:hypothetical protein